MKDNKLIAEFEELPSSIQRKTKIVDGRKVKSSEDVLCYFVTRDQTDNHMCNWVRPEELRYHESWDLLMPVVKHISDIHQKADGVLFDMIGDEFDEVIETFGYIDIRDTYNAVVKFIKWYNKINNNEESNK